MVAWIALALALIGCISPLTFLLAIVALKRDPQLLGKLMTRSLAKRRTSTSGSASVTFEVPRG